MNGKSLLTLLQDHIQTIIERNRPNGEDPKSTNL